LPLEITNIQAQKKAQRFNLFVDHKFESGISEDTLIQFQLYKGKTITANELAQIKSSEQINQAKLAALNYLAYQPRSCFEIEQYLHKKGFAKETTAAAISKMQSLKLLDDLQLAQNYLKAMQKSSDNGPLLLKKKLWQKKIPPELIEQAFSSYDHQMEKQLLKKLVNKYFQHYDRDSFSQKIAKIKQRLFAKGFALDAINTALETLPAPNIQQEQQALTVQLEKIWHSSAKLPASKRKQRCIACLLRKGFSFDDIQSALSNFIE
jgi:regulatory protein